MYIFFFLYIYVVTKRAKIDINIEFLLFDLFLFFQIENISVIDYI